MRAMKSWSNTLHLTEPLRDVLPASALAEITRREAAQQAAIQTAYERGRLEGEKSLSELLLRQRTEMQQLLEGVIASLRKSVSQAIHDSEQTLVSLALEIAQKLVADLPITRELVEAAIRDALTEVEGSTQFLVLLHPADLELLQEGDSPLLHLAQSQEVCFQSSPEVTRGGCLVQTRFGVIDARRETKLDLLKRNLLQ
jgi:flagellar assembly protein FliH